MKALCCLYPDEHPFKTMTPHARSPSTSESGHYNATRSGPESPLETPYPGGDTLLQDPEPSQWQVEGGSPVPYRGPSISSASPYKGVLPYQSVHHDETRLAPPFGYNTLSLCDERPSPWSPSNVSTDDMKFITGDAELGGIPGAYDYASNMPLDLNSISNRTGFHQPSFSAELQAHYNNPPLDIRYLNTAFYPHDTHNSNSGAHTTIFSQPETSNIWNNLEGHEYITGAQTPNVDFDDQETHFQSN
ncbi:hypothetical protein F4823DRAFT_575891 [Ustulina deusta]|nr:hypothetical protein F4823DRAFT_575891 [Ustulina deusta]